MSYHKRHTLYFRVGKREPLIISYTDLTWTSTGHLSNQQSSDVLHCSYFLCDGVVVEWWGGGGGEGGGGGGGEEEEEEEKEWEEEGRG